MPSERVAEQLKNLPTKPGVYLFRDERGPGALRRQGEVAAPARALVLPGARPRPADDLAAARARARRRGDRHEHRGRGAAPRAEPRQAAPAAVQRAAARRQVVPVHRGHRRGRVPARDVHARAAPARRRLLRAVREREEGARDARRAEPRLPLPAVRGPEAGPALGHPLPRLPHRPLPRALRRLHLARPSTRRSSTASCSSSPATRSRSSASSSGGCARPPRRSASRRRRASATGSSRSSTSPSGRRRTGATSATSTCSGSRSTATTASCRSSRSAAAR